MKQVLAELGLDQASYGVWDEFFEQILELPGILEQGMEFCIYEAWI